jgi:hypothetical protein
MGSQIQCNAKQYPEIRAALTSNAKDWGNVDNPFHRELERLDALFVWKQGV